MLALKDLMGDSSIGDSPISHFPFWVAPLDTVSPAQLVSFRARMSLQERCAEATSILSAVIAAVRDAAEKGVIPEVPLLGYGETSPRLLAMNELIAGFEQLHRPLPAAILFGLEMQVLAEEVETLTRRKVAAMRRLTPLAHHAVASQPASMLTDYVFWREQGASHVACFGLEAEAFHVYGLVWAQLLAAYRSMQWVDHQAEHLLWKDALMQTPVERLL